MRSKLLVFIAAMIVSSFSTYANDNNFQSLHQNESTSQPLLLAYDSSSEGKQQCKQDCAEALTPCLEGANSPDARAHCYEQFDSCVETCQ